MEESDTESEPTERNAKRRAQQIMFDEDGYADGWVYRVPKAFRPALDVILSTRVRAKTLSNGTKIKQTYQEWTEGDPPLYAFREFDSLTSREVAYGTTNRFVAQIGHSEPDMAQQRAIVPGSVRFRLLEWIGNESGSYSEIGWYSCSQSEFVNFLKSGVAPAAQTGAGDGEKE